MTNEEMIQDLKQFITTTVSQQTVQLDKRIDGVEQRLTDRIDGLDEKLDQALDAIGDTVTHVADGTETAVREHEEYYHGRLKHRAA